MKYNSISFEIVKNYLCAVKKIKLSIYYQEFLRRLYFQADFAFSKIISVSETLSASSRF